MKFNDVVTPIKVNPQTYEVSVKGKKITSKFVDKVSLGQLYSLF